MAYNLFFPTSNKRLANNFHYAQNFPCFCKTDVEYLEVKLLLLKKLLFCFLFSLFTIVQFFLNFIGKLLSFAALKYIPKSMTKILRFSVKP